MTLLDVETPSLDEGEPVEVEAPGEGGTHRTGSGRGAVAVSLPVVATAVMVGGAFTGPSARLVASVAGLLGVALASVVGRLRRPLAVNLAAAAGLVAIGLAMVVPSGPDAVFGIRRLVADAAAAGNVLRPPVPFTAGWPAIVGWLMALVGFAAAWVAVVVERPAASLLVPLPLAALAAVSVPESGQLASGLIVLVLFAAALGVLASGDAGGDGGRPSLAFELRRAARSVPLVAVISVAVMGLAQADVLFPDPYIDPTQEAQRPRTVPPSKVVDRVLFTVDSAASGPWRLGSLDVYDGSDWRLPPFAENGLAPVPRSGIVDEDLRDRQGLKAIFSVAGLTGAVLPTLPNTVGVVAEGPKLDYDSRNGNIRVAEGQVPAGLRYTVTAASLPSVADLQKDQRPLPRAVEQFARMPVPPPPAVVGLIAQAPKTSKWDEFDFLRGHVLDDVVATGAGAPVAVTADRVQDMLAGSHEGSPFEIVAAQAMLGRWIGLPTRIGYGFDGGEVVDGLRQVRPRDGSTFVEVYFPGFKWLPVIGTPRRAKPSVGGDPGQQRFDASVLPSDDVRVQLWLPVVVPATRDVLGQARRTALTIMVVAAVLAAAYLLWPVLRKARARGRRREAAVAAGPLARVALAYAEWRDHAADLGVDHPTDTPLRFLDRLVPDDEHTELAWLATRAMWGDLQGTVDTETALAAEELSRSLRRRLSESQPWSVRAVAAVSRTSVRRPYAPATDLTRSRAPEDRAPALV